VKPYRVQIGDIIEECDALDAGHAWNTVGEKHQNAGTLPKVDMVFVTDLETLRVKAYSIIHFADMTLVTGKE
jgi:hypothetical protein